MDAPLTAGTTFKIIEPAKEGDVMVGYKIAAPEAGHIAILRGDDLALPRPREVLECDLHIPAFACAGLIVQQGHFVRQRGQPD